MAILLWIAGAVALVARMPQLAVSIWAVNLINGAFSFWQEYKAEKATEAMRRLLPVYARVLRDGKGQRVPAQELVPGDVRHPFGRRPHLGDARLVEEADLRLDQSTLTGESVQVRKTCEATRNRSLTRIEIPNIVFTGTSVVSGTGKAVVFATGMETEFGKIAGFTQSLADAPSPLQREMQRVTKMVTAIAVSMGGVFFLLAVVLAGVDLAESFIFGMGMIVAFVPEGLLSTVTLSLAMGVQRMARRNALIKRLSSVEETLGSASVICTDKTGTLTQNEMTVRHLWLNGRSLSVTGTGYVPEGEILEAGRSLRAADHPALHRLLVAAGLCNNARLLPPEGETPHWTILGDPTPKGPSGYWHSRRAWNWMPRERLTPRLHELPFESRRKRMSTLHGAPSMTGVVYAKGAPREILGLCTRVLVDGGDQELDEALREQIMNANDAYARNGLRVLAVGQRILPAEPHTDFRGPVGPHSRSRGTRSHLPGTRRHDGSPQAGSFPGRGQMPPSRHPHHHDHGRLRAHGRKHRPPHRHPPGGAPPGGERSGPRRHGRRSPAADPPAGSAVRRAAPEHKLRVVPPCSGWSTWWPSPATA